MSDENFDRQGWQVRVVDERDALAAKIELLEKFIDTSHVYAKLARPDQLLLLEQLKHMAAYDDVLRQRIARFAPEAA